MSVHNAFEEMNMIFEWLVSGSFRSVSTALLPRSVGGFDRLASVGFRPTPDGARRRRKDLLERVGLRRLRLHQNGERRAAARAVRDPGSASVEVGELRNDRKADACAGRRVRVPATERLEKRRRELARNPTAGVLNPD